MDVVFFVLPTATTKPVIAVFVAIPPNSVSFKLCFTNPYTVGSIVDQVSFPFYYSSAIVSDTNSNILRIPL